MPVPKKNPTTSTAGASMPESSSNVMPEQEDFRQHLRRLAVSAVQVLLEQIMLEELEQCLGACLRRNYPHTPRLSQWLLHA
jgi:putative transposase